MQTKKEKKMITLLKGYISDHCWDLGISREMLTEFIIPDGIIFINWEAFYDCRSLTSISIPDGVRRIDDEAFSGCTSLTSITIPDSVTEISN